MPDDHDRQLLAHLGQQPGWEALRRLAERKMEEEFLLLAHKLANRKPQAVTHDEHRAEVFSRIDYRRGFFAGMKFLLDNPTLEAKRLEKALAEEDDG